MKIYRKPPVSTLLSLLLVHLIGDAAAGHNNRSIPSAEKSPGKVILEEVIISGSGNGTRVNVDAVARDSTQIEDDILAFLQKRETRRRRAGRPSSRSDRAANQSRRNDEIDFQGLDRAIAGYEPRRITSRKSKRKVVDGVNGTHDTHGISGESAKSATANFQTIYQEMLRNISRGVPELITSNANAPIFNPYLFQTKGLKQIHVPQEIVSTDDINRSPSSDVNFSHTSPATIKIKKTRKLKKYLRPIAMASRLSSVDKSKPEASEEVDTANNELGKEYLNVSNGEPKNVSTQPPLNAYVNRTETPANRREWNLQESSTAIPLFTSSLNTTNAYNALDLYDLSNLNLPSSANGLHSPSTYKAEPRPFSTSQLSNSPVTNSLELSHRKPNSSPVNSKQITRSSGNVLPLVLPTDLLGPTAARRYVPIKRANRLNPEKNFSATTASPTSSSAGGISVEKPNAVYGLPYTYVRRSTVAANGQSTGRPNYYPITGNLAERSVAETARTATYAPEQASALYNVQRPKESQIIRKNDFLPADGPDGKLDPNFNIGLALYNRFANLYSTNAPEAAKQDYQNFQQPTSPSHAATISQQVPALPYYVTVKPNSLALPKIRPIAPVKPALAPYYDSRLLVPQDGKQIDVDKNGKQSIGTSFEYADKTGARVVDDRNNLGNYQTRVNHEVHKIRENQQGERDDSEEDQQQTRDSGHQDQRQDDGNDERNVRLDDDEDEDENEESDETQAEYVSAEKSDGQNRDYYRRYGKHTHNREDPEEERQRVDHEEYESQRDHRDKSDRRTDVGQQTVRKEKYSDSRNNDDGSYKRNQEHRDRYDRRKSDNRREKSRQDHRREDLEDVEDVEDRPIAHRSKNEDGSQKEYEKKRVDDSYTTRKYRHRETAPQSEYSETRPKHVRKEYNRQYAKDDRHDEDDDKEVHDHVHGETQEHAHKHKEHHEKKDGGDHNFEEGEGAELEEEHHGHEGEKGNKGYKVWHEHEKAEKGHHDKEHASKEYDEKDGEDKKHEEEGGYHEEHHQGEEGEKTAEFGEKGEHKKGHSTHGEHSVHKKDEYEKKTEFFDEFHEGGDVEKHGEHHHEHESKKGGHEKKGHHDSADHEEKHGKKEEHEKGGHHHEHKGHKVDEGHDHHYDHDEKYGKKEGHEHGKKWSFKKGDDGGSAAGGEKHR